MLDTTGLIKVVNNRPLFIHTQVLGTYKFDDDLQYPQNNQQAIHCLNLLVTNALRHVPDVLTYMEHICLQFLCHSLLYLWWVVYVLIAEGVYNSPHYSVL